MKYVRHTRWMGSWKSGHLLLPFYILGIVLLNPDKRTWGTGVRAGEEEGKGEGLEIPVLAGRPLWMLPNI